MTGSLSTVYAKQATRIESRLSQCGDTCDLFVSADGSLPDLTAATLSTVPCDVDGIDALREPQSAEQVVRMGYNPREFRLVTLPVSVLDTAPVVRVNTVIRVYPGANPTASHDYNVVEEPNTDETAPLSFTLQCMPLPDAEEGA